jgi:beta-phosphoglucomutase-like phosphatase (HAD superfamily)
MILDAAAAMNAPIANCVVIGDKTSDVEAALSAGARAIKIEGAHALVDAVEQLLEPTR